jgi:hypothetical protein
MEWISSIGFFCLNEVAGLYGAMHSYNPFNAERTVLLKVDSANWFL